MTISISSRACKFHGLSRFLGNLCTIKDDGEFSCSYKYIYPKQLKLKLEHQGEHKTFLELNMSIDDDIFIYMLFDKRDKFPFFTVRMPYLSRNIPSPIFYVLIFSEFLRIARCTIRLTDFVPKASEFILEW